MQITKISHDIYFRNQIQISKQETSNTQAERKSFLDNIQSKVKNASDMTDTIVVPRTIFKGYLGIMTGTTIVTLGGLINREKHPAVFKGTMAGGLLTSLYGTWAFVRPFIVKDAKGVQKQK